MRMNTYRVTWAIDVEAESPRDAAVAAMRMQDEHTTANVFTVNAVTFVRGVAIPIRPNGSVTVDLGDEPRHMLPEFGEVA